MRTISFKVSEDEARVIRSRARQEHVSMSEYLRRRACGGGPNQEKPKKIRCPQTGAMIFAPLDSLPPLTTESVREILADFP